MLIILKCFLWRTERKETETAPISNILKYIDKKLGVAWAVRSYTKQMVWREALARTIKKQFL